MSAWCDLRSACDASHRLLAQVVFQLCNLSLRQFGTAVRQLTARRIGTLVEVFPNDLFTHPARLGGGHFADYPTGQYAVDSTAELPGWLSAFGLQRLVQSDGHRDDDALGQFDLFELSELLQHFEEGADSGAMLVPLFGKPGDGDMALVGLQVVAGSPLQFRDEACQRFV